MKYTNKARKLILIQAVMFIALALAACPTEVEMMSRGITLTASNPSTTIYVGAGVSGRVPVSVTVSSAEDQFLISHWDWYSDPALYDATGTLIAYQNLENDNFGYTILTGQTVTVYAGTGGNVAGSYIVEMIPRNITLTASNPSATIYVGAGVNGRVPVTVTAPSTRDIFLISKSWYGDPALYDATGTLIVYQNFEYYNFEYIIPAGQTVSVYAGTGGNVAENYIVEMIPRPIDGITLTENDWQTTVYVGTGVSGRVPVTVTAPSTRDIFLISFEDWFVDPALYDVTDALIAYQNFGNYSFAYTIPAGQTVTVYVGTWGNVAGSYTVASVNWRP